MTEESPLIRWMPAVFVLIWSTGFIVARYGMPHAPPMSFLAWRYALSSAAFGLWVAWSKPAWPRDSRQAGHLAVTGLLMHAGYLGGVWAAVKAGMGAGLVALIVGLQPLLTAVWVSWMGAEHRVSRQQWLGLLLGFGGLVLVVWHKLHLGETAWASVGLAVLALFSITCGTLYQKWFVKPCDVRTANLLQLLSALTVTLPLAWLESESMRWNTELVASLAWSVGALTLGASSLLYMLIQRGAATKVASLMYLVPPCTALMAAALFSEKLTLVTLSGMAMTVLGVAWVVRSASR